MFAMSLQASVMKLVEGYLKSVAAQDQEKYVVQLYIFQFCSFCLYSLNIVHSALPYWTTYIFLKSQDYEFLSMACIALCLFLRIESTSCNTPTVIRIVLGTSLTRHYELLHNFFLSQSWGKHKILYHEINNASFRGTGSFFI